MAFFVGTLVLGTFFVSKMQRERNVDLFGRVSLDFNVSSFFSKMLAKESAVFFEEVCLDASIS